MFVIFWKSLQIIWLDVFIKYLSSTIMQVYLLKIAIIIIFLK